MEECLADVEAIVDGPDRHRMVKAVRDDLRHLRKREVREWSE
jgi:hypothetical protein